MCKILCAFNHAKKERGPGDYLLHLKQIQVLLKDATHSNMPFLMKRL